MSASKAPRAGGRSSSGAHYQQWHKGMCFASTLLLQSPGAGTGRSVARLAL
jgi:hypothetical protein